MNLIIPSVYKPINEGRTKALGGVKESFHLEHGS